MSWAAGPIQDVARYLTIKRLTCSDGFTTNAIKLPRSSQGFLCPDAKPRTPTTVCLADERGGTHELVATPLGPSVCLSRIGPICNALSPSPGDFIVFFADTDLNLRVTTRKTLPDDAAEWLRERQAALAAARLKHQAAQQAQSQQAGRNSGHASHHDASAAPAVATATASDPTYRLRDGGATVPTSAPSAAAAHQLVLSALAYATSHCHPCPAPAHTPCSTPAPALQHALPPPMDVDVEGCMQEAAAARASSDGRDDDGPAATAVTYASPCPMLETELQEVESPTPPPHQAQRRAPPLMVMLHEPRPAHGCTAHDDPRAHRLASSSTAGASASAPASASASEQQQQEPVIEVILATKATSGPPRMPFRDRSNIVLSASAAKGIKDPKPGQSPPPHAPHQRQQQQQQQQQPPQHPQHHHHSAFNAAMDPGSRASSPVHSGAALPQPQPRPQAPPSRVQAPMAGPARPSPLGVDKENGGTGPSHAQAHARVLVPTGGASSPRPSGARGGAFAPSLPPLRAPAARPLTFAASAAAAAAADGSSAGAALGEGAAGPPSRPSTPLPMQRPAVSLTAAATVAALAAAAPAAAPAPALTPAAEPQTRAHEQLPAPSSSIGTPLLATASNDSSDHAPSSTCSSGPTASAVAALRMRSLHDTRTRAQQLGLRHPLSVCTGPHSPPALPRWLQQHQLMLQAMQAQVAALQQQHPLVSFTALGSGGGALLAGGGAASPLGLELAPLQNVSAPAGVGSSHEQQLQQHPGGGDGAAAGADEAMMECGEDLEVDLDAMDVDHGACHASAPSDGANEGADGSAADDEAAHCGAAPAAAAAGGGAMGGGQQPSGSQRQSQAQQVLQQLLLHRQLLAAGLGGSSSSQGGRGLPLALTQQPLLLQQLLMLGAPWGVQQASTTTASTTAASPSTAAGGFPTTGLALAQLQAPSSAGTATLSSPAAGNIDMLLAQLDDPPAAQRSAQQAAGVASASAPAAVAAAALDRGAGLLMVVQAPDAAVAAAAESSLAPSPSPLKRTHEEAEGGTGALSSAAAGPLSCKRPRSEGSAAAAVVDGALDAAGSAAAAGGDAFEAPSAQQQQLRLDLTANDLTCGIRLPLAHLLRTVPSLALHPTLSQQQQQGPIGPVLLRVTDVVRNAEYACTLHIAPPTPSPSAAAAADAPTALSAAGASAAQAQQADAPLGERWCVLQGLTPMFRLLRSGVRDVLTLWSETEGLACAVYPAGTAP